jgi:ABC-type antimicrobial peptide transport system permease subunit
VNGYQAQVVQFSGNNLRINTQIDVVLSPIDAGSTFTNGEILVLNDYITNEEGIEKIYYNYVDLVEVVSGEKIDFLELKVANVLSLVDDERIITEFTVSEGNILINDELQGTFDRIDSMRILGSSIDFSVEDENIVHFREQGALNSDILIDSSSPILPSELENTWNNIELRFSELADQSRIIRELSDFSFIQLTSGRADQIFIEISVTQITDIMLILQAILSLLLILSISYTILSIIQDSEKEIQVMKMIGFRQSRIRLLFIGQSILIGIFAYLFAVIMSILLVGLLTAITHLSLDLPYLTFNVILKSQLIIFLFSVGISAIAGVIPMFNQNRI